MINAQKYSNIDEYIEILYRRIWYIVIPFAILFSAALGYALLAPKRYMAETMILVTPQRVPQEYVKSTITLGIEARLQSISQEIMSRTRLEKIMTEMKLYVEESKSLTREEVIELMRKDIFVKMGGREGYFSISYKGKDPNTVAMVTNKLASLYIEENLKFREAQAQGTSEFLALELNSTREKLDEQERAISDFKRRYLPELPDQRESNLKILGKFQLDQQRISDNLKSAQDRKMVIQKQVSELEALSEKMQDEKPAPSSAQRIGAEALPSPPSKPEKKNPDELLLAQLKNQLKDLRAKYTDRHPDVVEMNRKISDLEKGRTAEKIEVQTAERVKEKAPAPVAASAPLTQEKKKDEFEPASNPFYQEMQGQLLATDAEIKRLKEEDSGVRKKIAQYEMRVENAPVRELALIELSRDYNNLKQTYERLLQKSTEAQQSENLEHRQKGEQFRVIDPAKVPEKPFQPNIPRILLAGFLLGMVSGVGLAFVKEQTDRSFRNAEDVEDTLGLKVIVSIPRVEMKSTPS